MDPIRLAFNGSGKFATDHASPVSSAPASHFDFSPGNGTRYVGVALDLPCSLLDPNSEERETAVIVYLFGQPVVMTHVRDAYVAASSVTEKTGLVGSDADAMATLVAHYSNSGTDSPYVFAP